MKNHLIRILLLLTLTALCLLPLIACTGGDTPSDTDAASDTRPEDTPTDPVTDPATDAPTEPATEAPTDPVTEPETEPATDAPETLPPEDLSLPENALKVWYASDIKDIKKPAAGQKVANNLNRTLNEDAEAVTDRFINLSAKGKDPYLFLSCDAITPGGRYLLLKYRTTAAFDGGIYLGTKGVSAAGAQPLDYNADGQWHLIRVDMYDNLCFSGSAFNYLRLDPLEGDAEVKDSSVDVAWVAVLPDDGAPYVREQTFPTLPPDCPDLSSYTELNEGAFALIADGAADDVLDVGEGLTYDVYYRSFFNRYSFTYDADGYLKGTITCLYMDKDGNMTEKDEEFFLEPGTGVTFSSLIDGYLNDQYACGISRITVRACEDKAVRFCLRAITSDIRRVYASGVYYMENARFRLGVQLSWGGGICYIEDLCDNDDSLTNLINNHDTGRLIQQSYYGVSSSTYSPATYGGNTWSYNPVQGGDQYGNHSKLVDFTISEDGTSIWVKTRAMDWAQRGMLTPSYMENTYTLAEDAISVDNRFIDFFGQKGPNSHQELPAFYTISYLSDFCYYDGSKPWTGDDYITLKNQPFWAGNGSCYHNVRAGNTEVWGAWVAPDGYGIGVFVPGTEILLAGRNAYNGAKSGSADACNYVAPLRTFRIISYQPFAYSYVITTGQVEDMRAVFAEYAQ